MSDQQKIGTTAIHAGKGPYDGALPTQPVVEPLYMGSMFEYDSVEDYMDCIVKGLPYPMYTRAASGNPTLRARQNAIDVARKTYQERTLLTRVHVVRSLKTPSVP